MRRAFRMLLLAVPAVVFAQFDLPSELRTRIPVRVPALDKLLEEKPPVTTSLVDARTDIPLLDDFDPQTLAPLLFVPRGPAGSLSVLPGLWEAQLQSYCLKPGTYGPGEGDGYIPAPLTGPHADIVRKLLAGSQLHPEIPQEQIQLLVWAIVLRTRISELAPEPQDVAHRLLTPAEITKIERNAAGEVQPDVVVRLIGTLPDAVREAVQAQFDVRRLLTQNLAVPFAELATTAVLSGDPEPPPGSREVPWGRWSYCPPENTRDAGLIIRFLPDGYACVRIELYSPERLRIEADRLGRITTIADPQGNRIDTEYDDDAGRLSFRGDPAVTGHAFRSIRLTGPDPEKPSQMRASTYPGTGWALVGVPSGRGEPAEGAADRFPEARERYAWAIAQCQALGTLGQELGRLKPARGAPDARLIASIVDLAHYARALKLALPSAAEDEATQSWLADRLGLAYRALAVGITGLASAPRGQTAVGWSRPQAPASGGPTIRLASFQTAWQLIYWDLWFPKWFPKEHPVQYYNPANTVAVPGNTANQRLALSGVYVPTDRWDANMKQFKQAGGQISGGVFVAAQVTGAATPFSAPFFFVRKQLDWVVNLYQLAGDTLAKIDPPRSDFRTTTGAEALRPTLPLVAEADVSPGTLAASTELLRAAGELAANLRATLLAYDRCGGALQAGEREWIGRQIEAMVSHERASGEAMFVLADRLEDWLRLLREAGVEDVTVTAEAIAAYQGTLRDGGFSAQRLAAARGIGLTEQEIAACLPLLLAVEPEEAAGSEYEKMDALVVALRALGKDFLLLPAVQPQP